MVKYFFPVLACFVFMTACGVSKKKEETPSLSKADYAYIMKFHEGVRYKSKGMVDEALLVFEDCHTKRPQDDAVCFALSELYLKKGEKIRAGEFISKAAKLDPKNKHYLTELAYFQYDSGEFKAASKSFQSLMEKEPRNPDYQFGLAECYVQLGSPQKAIDILNKTESQMGIIPELSIQKYTLFMQMKKVDLALKELTAARESQPNNPQLLGALVDHYFKQNEELKAIKTLQDMAKVDPENGRVHLFLSEVYRQRGDRKEYLNALKMAFMGQGINIDQKMQALITLQQTSRLVTQAELDLVSILEVQHPKQAKTHSIKGDFLMDMDRSDEALVSYKKALEFDKSVYPIWNQVLIMEFTKGLTQELYTDSKACLELFPLQPTPYLLFGVAANQLEKFEEAKEALSNGVAYVINDAPLKGEFTSQIGESEFGLGNTKEAIQQYKKAMKTDPGSSLIPNNLAYRLAKEKIELDYAAEMAVKAINTGGRQAQFLDTYGYVLFQKGEYKLAKKNFEEAYQTMTSDPILLEHLGDVYVKLNETEKAVEFWKKAKELNSKSTTLDQKIETKAYVD